MSGVHYLTGLAWLWLIYYLIKNLWGHFYFGWIVPNYFLNDQETPYLVGWLIPTSFRPCVDRALPYLDRYLYGTPMKHHTQSEQDVYRTAVILSRVLDQDVVIQILDMAGMWPDVPLASRVNRKLFEVRVPRPRPRAGRNSPGTVYLSATIPPTIPPRTLRCITFSVSSADTGLNPETTNASVLEQVGTWFDVVVTSPDGMRTWKAPRLIKNPHEKGDIDVRRATMSYDDKHPQIRNLLGKMGPGWQIEIEVWAEPPYENFVQSARIDLQVRAVRKI